MNLLENEEILLESKIKKGIASPILFFIFALLLQAGFYYLYAIYVFDTFYLAIGVVIIEIIFLIAIIWLLVALINFKKAPRIYLTNYRVILYSRIIFDDYIVDCKKDGLYISLPLDKITNVFLNSADNKKATYGLIKIYSYNLCLSYGYSKDCVEIYNFLNAIISNTDKDN